MDFRTNPTIWSGNAWVVSNKALVETIFQRILTNAGITEEFLGGNTQVKEQLWRDTAELGVHMNVGTKVWAENKTVPDLVLAAAMHYTISDLGYGAIQNALDKMNFIAGKVALIPVLDLPNVNITSAQITDYGTKIIALTAAAPQFRVAQTAQTAATGDIVADFKLLRAAKNRQKSLIHTFKISNASFVSAYDIGSEIIDLGKGMTTEEAVMHPGEHVAWFHEKFLPGDTVTIRNHSVLAGIKVYLSDTTDVPATGGFEIGAMLDFKLSVPTDFNCPFGHYVIIVNMSGTDDARVTGILAEGASHSVAPAPPLH